MPKFQSQNVRVTEELCFAWPTSTQAQTQALSSENLDRAEVD